ncbi:MAG: hypothetical protein JXL80_13800 [Planctomycetes bacterium]|nr:hypothetical protein [Planctomycetota bacterium]
MDIRAALKGQYHASLAMLKQTIELCPEDVWNASEQPVAFWRVVYHTLFFTHLYLQPNNEAFRPWEHHREEYQFLGNVPWPPHHKARIGVPYTRAQMLDYWQFCDAMVDTAVDRLDLDAQQCGFPWYRLPKLDHQVNNIRHLQHHTALLAGRLRLAAGTDVQWVGPS